MSTEQAVLLTSKERLAALADGAAIYQSGNQVVVLCGLISALTKDEMREAMAILGGVQDRGNFQTQEVWDTLWKQWGRVDPMGCIADFGEDARSKSRKDARNVMAGWLETNADAALAWAMEPKTAPLQAAAAALAITNNANGDLNQLQSAIRALPADSPTARECLNDYFDLASLTGKDPSAADIYDELDPALQAAAWPVAMRRLALADPQQAATWLEKHASDPGADYSSTSGFVQELAMQDPAGTAKWAMNLPGVLEKGTNNNPLIIVISQWAEIDPEAAKAWAKANLPR